MQYQNNDDSRLAAIEGANFMFGDYVYDQLGQRVLKADLGLIIFVYDVFGNLIGEYYSDRSNKVARKKMGGAPRCGASVGVCGRLFWQSA